MTDTKDLLSDFGTVISLIEKNLKYLDSLDMDEETLKDYRKVINYLKGMSAEEICTILSSHSSKKKSHKDVEPQLSDEELQSMDIEELRKSLASSKLSRITLERIASIRFGVTKGALSTLRSRDSLKDKLFNMIANEEAHLSISRAITGQEKVRQND